MKNMLLKLWSWKEAQDGQTLIEYGLIAALIVIVVVATLGLIGDNILAIFTQVETDTTLPAAS